MPIITTSLLAGAVAGAVADAAVHPVDTVRARLQTRTVVYRGLWDGLRTVAAREGVRGLYSGFGVVASFTAPAHALYYTAYEVCKRRLPDSPGGHFTAGLAADMAAAVVWTPQDVIKQRMQVQHADGRQLFRGSWDALVQTVRRDGVRRGLYRGYGAALASWGPFVGLYFVVYEQWKRRVADWMEGGDVRRDSAGYAIVPAWAQLVGGAVAGGVAAAVTNPVDVVKTIYQVQHHESTVRHRSSWHVFRHLVSTEGYSALMRGVTARVMWIVPATSISMVCFESLRDMMEAPPNSIN